MEPVHDSFAKQYLCLDIVLLLLLRHFLFGLQTCHIVPDATIQLGQ